MEKLKRIKKELVEYGKKIAHQGLVVGQGGNISIRFARKVYLKASGISLEDAKENDYLSINLKAQIPEITSTGDVIQFTERSRKTSLRHQPSSEFRMHLGCYLARKDIRAVIHAHPPLATAVASSGRKLEPITDEFAIVMDKDIATIKYVPPRTKRLADMVSRLIRTHNGILMANHGVVVVGSTLKEAYQRIILIEREAKIYILSALLARKSDIKRVDI